MTTDQRPLGPELILEKNDVYTRWLHLQQREHPREADAALQVSEDLGVTIEVVDDGIFAGQLTEAEIRCRDAAGRYEDARAERNAMVLKAISRRWTHAQIALATGLTRARVGQIALTDGSTKYGIGHARAVCSRECRRANDRDLPRASGEVQTQSGRGATGAP